MSPVPSPPPWLARVPDACAADLPEWFAAFPAPPDARRTSAVLMLFGPAAPSDGRPATAPQAGSATPPVAGTNVDVVLTERAHALRSHAAQVAFPGGHVDPSDEGPVDAALREATEEVGLDRDTVDVLGTLPALYLHPSGNAVTPVLAWWREPHPIGVVDEAEVARVVRAPVDDLLAPANRFTVTTPQGYATPGFDAGGLFVWGFTAKLIEAIVDLGGLATPWDESVTRPLPAAVVAGYRRVDG